VVGGTEWTCRISVARSNFGQCAERMGRQWTSALILSEVWGGERGRAGWGGGSKVRGRRIRTIGQTDVLPESKGLQGFELEGRGSSSRAGRAQQACAAWALGCFIHTNYQYQESRSKLLLNVSQFQHYQGDTTNRHTYARSCAHFHTYPYARTHTCVYASVHSLFCIYTCICTFYLFIYPLSQF